ncbi:MAG: formate dehydrogenase accessory sulfurtransferase FdhD [Schlesneria sp.]|nr:formate dehydrogenase accessory sulfurtransferase FdhD [Schlesneria sp.]
MANYHPGITTVSIISMEAGVTASETDELSVEEPLEIGVRVQDVTRSIAVTMRTPGNDVELAAGFLFTEGILRDKAEIVEIRETDHNVVTATLNSTVRLDPAKLDRHSFVSSSCGVCGKRSIAAVFAIQHHRIHPGTPQIEAGVIHRLPAIQRAAQDNFRRTGGIHASALFSSAGQLLSSYEDVGRHNALDKLIGSELLAGRLPLGDKILLVSGRASFELIQKASVAGIPVVAAIGAPSSLAVELARQTSMTLLGFVRDDRFNVYTDSGRLDLSSSCFDRNPHSVAVLNL